ncbi:hypothetical protein, unknown function [Leishmania tarentolae]|uniref:TNase-like domain-containing protein n=1 Tax=Leishmania tarentolae TaxID=5689 RepID=A0A640K8S3_LEITA|nr:hypothetical protein, unknown function [Leishmania tarentolae]
MGNFCCSGEHQTAEKSAETVKASLAIFEELPSGAEEATVDHVYDGDTMTICEHNKKRVRLIGIDAPELSGREPYAREAADFVKRLCPTNSKVWLKAPKGNQKDRYNRMLALVFVANPCGGSGFVCVNIAVVEQGLGTFYAPAHSRVEFEDRLIEAQQSAMQRKVNLWKRQNLHRRVFRTRYGTAFHTEDCSTIQKRIENLQIVSMKDALLKGYSPCRHCKPQQ